MKVEMCLHVYMLASYLAEAKALLLQDGERTVLLEIALNAEKEIESLRAIATAEQGHEEDEARTKSADERESQSSEGSNASAHD